ncbi:Protein CBG18658 [Caenorhabditis briggsae]|uniref:Protein CBG18658 n=1 Tax=Caenorhabditis briggsae TaxID=6238 RepID=A8XTU2_CAEBR|nr:Protein CBG18658 [Caenorhabditis briggsae]CAP36068.1 Protein CBG18658 [Caenorhabditis briggsae]
MDMPHIVMTKIMGNVGFLAILNLRKTCKTFRNFIDDVKPINDLKELRITLGHFYVKVEVFLDKNGYDADRCSFVSSYQQAPDDNTARGSRTREYPLHILPHYPFDHASTFSQRFKTYIQNTREKQENIFFRFQNLQAFLTNPYFKRWQLQYEDSEGDDMIHNILGRIPHEEQEKWFYGIPNSTEVLCIQSVYQTVWTVSFTRINLVDVPENAWVHWE